MSRPTDRFRIIIPVCHHFAGLGPELAPPPLLHPPSHYRLASANCYGISPTPRLCGLWLFIINVPLFSTANSPEPAGSKEPRPHLCPFHFPFQLSRSSVTRIFQSFIQRFGDFRWYRSSRSIFVREFKFFIGSLKYCNMLYVSYILCLFRLNFL